jgi:hypothetical protein
MHQGARGERTSFDDQDDATRVQFVGVGRKMEYTIAKTDGKIDEHFEFRNGLALLSDLHKGTGTGGVWRRFIDATAIFLLFAALSGVVLWISTKKRRRLGVIALIVSIVLCAGCYLFMMP